MSYRPIPFVKTFEIVGYVYETELWHPACVLRAIGIMENPQRAVGGNNDLINTFVRNYGRLQLGLGNEDVRWQDGDVIPQPIFVGDDGWSGEHCADCKEELEP